jgi:hypothetical protein
MNRLLIIAISGGLLGGLLALAPLGVAGDSPDSTTAPASRASAVAPPQGVCPPFKLRDEQGEIIDPRNGVNASVPYSPKQTCGASGCHNYDLITEGFHFTQGKGEKLPPEYAARYGWVKFPGNYGGNWCSPAPLYRELAAKQNGSARLIDMTSFEFVTATCGNCHPGGGPLEFDRDGHRYDERMRDPAAGLTPGGDNGFDGDYFKARWSETGVIEADCLLCHMPEYDFGSRNAQLAGLNFRWAATAGAGLAAVNGKVATNESPTVAYDTARFDAEGNVTLHIVPEPHTDTCLNCHFKPDWKKRGAGYSTRTDVHMAAGLLCVDCHAAGSRAADPRIRGKEVHQFGKGDDPSGFVRDDLDDTVRTCEACHLEGWRNAPRATHEWLPPMHMEKLSCQACHIPNRAVKSALVQASDVYNAAPRISPPGKHIWTFYDQEMKFWNHYGELDLFSAHDKPTDVTQPTLVRYKGKIYPANRVHSTFVGYEEPGHPGLHQLFMKDFFTMWKEHRADPTAKYPQLAEIKDDNGDGAPEVNRPAEIDALLAATKDYLTATKFPLDGKRLVWVSDSRAYYSSTEHRDLPHEEHEATAYASVYKFSHDIAPARAALGAGGCTDCHSAPSPFFDRPLLAQAFQASDGQPRWVPNHEILGLGSAWIRAGAFREQSLKPLMYLLLAVLAVVWLVAGLRDAAVRNEALSAGQARLGAWALLIVAVLGGVLAARTPDLLSYMLASRFTLDAKHFWVAAAILLGAIVTTLRPRRGPSRVRPVLAWLLWITVVLTGLCGGLMLLQLKALPALTRLAYTGFDAGLTLVLALTIVLQFMRLAGAATPSAGRVVAEQRA